MTGFEPPISGSTNCATITRAPHLPTCFKTELERVFFSFRQFKIIFCSFKCLEEHLKGTNFTAGCRKSNLFFLKKNNKNIFSSRNKSQLSIPRNPQVPYHKTTQVPSFHIISLGTIRIINLGTISSTQVPFHQPRYNIISSPCQATFYLCHQFSVTRFGESLSLWQIFMIIAVN